MNQIDIMDPESATILRFVVDAVPPYLGKPMVSLLSALGDRVAFVIQEAIVREKVALQRKEVVQRILAALSISFVAPNRILDPSWTKPTYSLALLDRLLQTDLMELPRERVEELRSRLEAGLG